MTTRTCPICSRQVSDDEPMARARVSGRGRRDWRWNRWQPVCVECVRTARRVSDDGKTSSWAGEVPGAGPVLCAVCSLPVLLDPDPRRKVSTCSDTCRSRYYTGRRGSVAPAVTACEGCGEAMTGRADRRYCSSACRQRSYRRRARLVQLGVTPDAAGNVDTFGALGRDQFEDVLRRARQDDDLSAEHVARLAQDVSRQA